MAKKRKMWDGDDMVRALEACRYGDSLSAAAKKVNVPRMTLSDRLRERVTIDAKIGRPSALTYEEERSLVGYIQYMHERRFPIDRSQVMQLAWAVDLKRNE